MSYQKVTHVLFDLDGLLIDSEIFYTQAFTNVCAKYGKSFTWELKKSLLGFQGRECAEKIVETLDLPLTKADFIRECQKHYEVLFPGVALMPGAQQLVEHLRKAGVPIALATSSSDESVKMKMQSHKGFLDNFHHLTMGSSDPDVKQGKPDPSIFLICASRFPDKPKPEEVYKCDIKNIFNPTRRDTKRFRHYNYTKAVVYVEHFSVVLWLDLLYMYMFYDQKNGKNVTQL